MCMCLCNISKSDLHAMIFAISGQTLWLSQWPGGRFLHRIRFLLLGQRSPWPTLSWQKLSWPQSSLPILSWPTLSWPPFRSPWPTLSYRYNIPTCGQGVEPNQCKCRFYACVKYFAQIPIFQNRDGSTFTPTSVTSPPCGGRPLNIDSCSCPNGNTITANNFIAAAVPLIQDILSG